MLGLTNSRRGRWAVVRHARRSVRRFLCFYGHAIAAIFPNLDKWVLLAEQACPGDAGRPSRGMHTRALKIFLPLLTANGRGEGRGHVRAVRNVFVVLTKNTKINDLPNIFAVKKLNNSTLWMCTTTETADSAY